MIRMAFAGALLFAAVPGVSQAAPIALLPAESTTSIIAQVHYYYHHHYYHHHHYYLWHHGYRHCGW